MSANPDRPSRKVLSLLAVFAFSTLLAASAAWAAGADPNECDDPSDAPDVIVGDLQSIRKWGHLRGIHAFSIGTTSCNVGTCWLNWITGSGNNNHPTIGGNMYRLENGRIEHIGQSWLKHGFFALSETVCSPDCLPTDGEHLGVNCSDPYSSMLNGQQNRLGPKFEVNPLTGFHPHPVTDLSMTGDEIYKRIQVKDEDIDPALHPTAQYFVEGQYIAQDDAAAGNQNNNATYKPIAISVTAPGEFRADYTGPAERMTPAIFAWKAADPLVETMTVFDAEGGMYNLAMKATDLGGGAWHYEYAIHNQTAHRATSWFAVHGGARTVIANQGFHDVAYHSGEPIDGTDWRPNAGAGGTASWATEDYVTSPLANALRWGTMYNFWFDADRPPGPALLQLGMFRTGRTDDPPSIAFVFSGPSPCNADGVCDPGEDCIACPNECSGQGLDNDGDGTGFCVDCNDNDLQSWAPISEALDLRVSRAGNDAVLAWQPPMQPGARSPSYEMLRSDVPSNFLGAVTCVPLADPKIPATTDVNALDASDRLFYLARALNTCSPEPGPTGGDSFGVPRVAADCP